jgi:hypothetical protein
MYETVTVSLLTTVGSGTKVNQAELRMTPMAAALSNMLNP